MEIDIKKVTQPYEYYLKFITQNCRPDNRKLSDLRTCNISFDCINTVNGSSIVKLGSTIVVCGVNARLCKPKEDRPDCGFFVCNVELPALSSSRNFKSAPSSHQSLSSHASATIEQSQAMLSQLMQDILIESKCLNEKGLCIKEGKLAWILYIDLICINNDGNVQDTCSLAMLSALKTLKLYEVDYNDDENKPIVKQPLNLIPFKLNSEPICTTLFAIEDNIIMVDPNKQEEDFMRTFLVICTVDKQNICLLRKYGGQNLSTDQMNLCIDKALQNGSQLRQIVNSSYEQSFKSESMSF
jgi:exosome complex component RRP43